MAGLAKNLASYLWGAEKATYQIPTSFADAAVKLEALASIGFGAAAFFLHEPLYLVGTGAGITDLFCRYKKADKESHKNPDYGRNDPELSFKAPGIIGQIREKIS
jgi:hypothetical protein